MSLEHVHPAPKSGLGRCPYCHEGIKPQEVGLWRCPGCGAHHHLECLEEFGHCTVYGCGSKAPSGRILTPSEFQAVKARRRARTFASRHLSTPPVLDPDMVALAQRVTVENQREPLRVLMFRLLPAALVALLALLSIIALLVAAESHR